MKITTGISVLGMTTLAISAQASGNLEASPTAIEIEQEKLIVAEYSGSVSAAIGDVWNAFTTDKGLASFYAPKALIEPRIGGRFELHLFPDNPVGQRGLEGLHILAFEPKQRLMMTWASPAFVREKLGRQNTIQEITLTASGPEETIVRFRQFGFGEDPAWDKAKWYFEARQRDVYLNLMERFESESGSVNWDTAMKRFWATSEYIKEKLEQR